MRDASLDALRFLGIVGVVLQHSLWVAAEAGGRPALAVLGLSMWAVPLLFATSGYLSTMGGRTVDLGRRMRRLLVPYAVWSVVLFAYAAQGAIRAGQPIGPVDWVGAIFAGEAFYTLWFLAMLAYATAVGWALRSARSRAIGAGVAAGAYVVLAVARFGQPVFATDTIAGFLVIAPYCVACYLVGALLPGLRRGQGKPALLAVAGVALAGDVFMYVNWGTKLSQNQQFAILGAGAITALLVLPAVAETRWDGRLASAVAWAGTFTLGVYAMHAPLLNIIRFVSHTRESTSLGWALALAVLSTVVSLGVSAVVARVRLLRPLVQ